MDATKKKAAALAGEAALKNTHLNYAPLAALVQANIDGQRMASDFLGSLTTHYPDPDSVYLALRTITDAEQDSVALAKLCGFARILQKRLEQTSGV